MNQPPNPMIANKARIAYKQAFLVLCLVSFFQIFLPGYSKAQQPTEPQDQPIDPAILKKYANQLSLSKSILQAYILNLITAKTRATSLIILLKKKYHLN